LYVKHVYETDPSFIDYLMIVCVMFELISETKLIAPMELETAI